MMAARTYEAPEVQGMVSRMFKALARRAHRGEVEALEALYDLQEDLDKALAAAVAGYREGPAEASWQAIGACLGITRQAAFQRWGHSTPSYAHPQFCQCKGPGLCEYLGDVYKSL